MTADNARCFEFLDDLRKSGVTNMYGASPYLQEEFDLDRDDARKVLLAWMRTFGDGSTPPRERACPDFDHHQPGYGCRTCGKPELRHEGDDTTPFARALEAMISPVRLFRLDWIDRRTFEILASKAEAELSRDALVRDGQTVRLQEFDVPTDPVGLADFLTRNMKP